MIISFKNKNIDRNFLEQGLGVRARRVYLSRIFVKKMGRLGFEPRTSRLKAECSTTELATRLCMLLRADA